MSAGRVTPAEWRWAAGFGAVVLAATMLPYLIGFASQTAAWRFGGLLIGVDDSRSYLAKMALGARGAWLFTPVYTSEPQGGVLLYPFYLLLGKLAGVDPTAQVQAFHAARLLGGALALAAAYRFLAEFLPLVRQRRLGLLLIALGGGLGWLLVLLGQSNLAGSLPLDFFLPEAYTFLSLYALPHLVLARALSLWGALAYVRGQWARAGLAWLGVALIQPIHVLTLWAVLGVDFLWTAWRERRWAWRGLFLAAGLPAPLVLYTVAIFSLEPVLRAWNSQSVLPSPAPIHYLLGYGLWLAPAAVGWRGLRRQPRLQRWVLAWLIVVPILVYLPLPIQRRLVEGGQMPLVILAVLGLTLVWRRRWLTWLVAGASTLTALFLLLGGALAARTPAAPIFLAADQLAVFRWTAAQVERGVGLGAYLTGNALPVYTPLVAYLGLTTETVAFTEKEAQVARFFAASTPDEERRRWLMANHIGYVFSGPAEQALGEFDPRPAPYLRERFRAGAYAVYTVQP